MSLLNDWGNSFVSLNTFIKDENQLFLVMYSYYFVLSHTHFLDNLRSIFLWLMVWIVNNMRHCQWHLANVPTSLFCCKLWLTADCPLKLIRWKLILIVRQLFRRKFWQMLAWLIAGLFFWFYLPIVRNIWLLLLLSCNRRSRKIFYLHFFL